MKTTLKYTTTIQTAIDYGLDTLLTTSTTKGFPTLEYRYTNHNFPKITLFMLVVGTYIKWGYSVDGHYYHTSYQTFIATMQRLANA